MNRHFNSLLLLLALSLLLSPGAVQAGAAEAVASVVAIRGQATATGVDGKPRPLKLKDSLYVDDTLKTDKGSRLQLMFQDNTLINLGTETEMKVSEFSWHPDKGGAFKTKVNEGTFRVMGGAIAKSTPEHFKTETRTATIGIRGSMYAGSMLAERLSVVFEGGRGIEVTNPQGTVVINRPGYGTHVLPSEPPQPPVRFSRQELDTINRALSGGRSESRERGSYRDQPGSDAPAEASATQTDGEAVAQGAQSVTEQGRDAILDSSQEGIAALVENESQPSRTGAVTWQGYVIGMAASQALPPTERLLFANSRASDFTLDIDWDNATANGSFKASGIHNASYSINNITVNGSGASQVHDGTLHTILSTPSDTDGLRYGTETTGHHLNPSETNTLVTSSGNVQLSQYTSWGYWNASFNDPASGSPYRFQEPAALWTAGETTHADAIKSLVLSNQTGAYTGKAVGVEIPADVNMAATPLTSSAGANPWGTVQLTVDFSSRAANPVSGSFNFDQATLPIGNGALHNASGFNAQVVGAAASEVNGTFFGPNADALGGNFHAEIIQGGPRYIGVFGADKQ
ncbi:MAG: transferrin-binding protein-like solute binding protein [Thermodesulfobacteriota bacterium]